MKKLYRLFKNYWPETRESDVEQIAVYICTNITEKLNYKRRSHVAWCIKNFESVNDWIYLWEQDF